MTVIDRRMRLGRFEIRALDRLLVAALLLCLALTVAFSARVPAWPVLALKDLAAVTIFLGLQLLSQKVSKSAPRFLIRTAGVLFAFVSLNLAVADLQLIFHGRWLDAGVLELESALFGVQPTLWLQRFISKPLTEWLFFCYVAYMPIYPTLAGLIFFRKGEAAAEDYLFVLGLTNVACNLGFLVYPVAGPLAYMGDQYAVPLDGSIWARIGEYFRAQWQFVGGTIPSLHCANATVMGLMAYRYVRPWFWVLAPVILSLYVSTVYCRYHYVTDSVAGIAVALALWAAASARRPAFERARPDPEAGPSAPAGI